MTAEQLAKMGDLRVMLRLEKKRHEQEVAAIEEKMAALRAGCDHKYPDGEWAVVSGITENACLLCAHTW